MIFAKDTGVSPKKKSDAQVSTPTGGLRTEPSTVHHLDVLSKRILLGLDLPHDKSMTAGVALRPVTVFTDKWTWLRWAA